MFSPLCRFAILSLSLILSACATISGSRQAIIFHTEPEGVAIYSQDKLLGVSPVLVQVPRQRDLKLELHYGGKKNSAYLQSKYRWRKSFLGNLLLFSYAPVGWGIDVGTGAAWEFPEQNFLATGFKDRGSDKTPGKSDLAIAPPLGGNPRASVEAGRLLEKKLQPHVDAHHEVFSYLTTEARFEENGYTFESTAPDNLNNLYYSLGVSEIYFSRFDDSDKLLLRGEIKNILDPSRNRKLDFTLSKQEIRQLEDLGFFANERKIFSWLPNAVFLEASNSATSLDTTLGTYKARTGDAQTFLGDATRYLSALSLRNVLLPPDQDHWRFRTRFLPTASFSYSKEDFPDNPNLSEVSFARTHIDVGYGPSLNYGGNHINFYANFALAGAYDRISTEFKGKKFQAESTAGSIILEVGGVYFFKKRWVARVFSRSTNVPVSLWDEVVGELSQGAQRVNSSALLTSGVAIGYCFTPSDFGF